MSGSDAIVVGEAWISEHYFTTEARSQSFQAKVLERRKQWDEEAAEGRPTARSRFTEARARLEVDLASLDEHEDPATKRAATEDVHRRVVEVLGLAGHGRRLDQDGPVLRVSAPGITEGAPLAVVHATAVGSVEDLLAKDGRTLADPVELADGEPITSAARLVSALFVAEGAPSLVLVLAGRWALLAEQERWAEGRYLAVDLQLVCERNEAKRGGEIDRALTCLSAESIAPDADGDLWWHGVLEESVKHTVGVSKDLREGVRLSIEILANDVVARRAAQGLEPLPQDQAQVLATQSLRFLYRILFLLYAEASPELGVLPVNEPEYAQGYSLDRLRELVQVELATPQSREGTHLYESLGVLFRLVDRGHSPKRTVTADGDSTTNAGLTFNSLRADLFTPQATAHIDTVGMSNVALQQVLSHLLLSKESRGRDRGFISYAELGINQLGAVYEGLMSYTGFFAETDLYEVAKGGDPSKGSWVVPVERAEGIDAKDFVRVKDPATGEERPVLHERGTFVYRLAGRERQQSASYYTPEVLTRFTVGQALEELLDQDGTTTTAAEVLELSVCEPALGSGAFAIEAVRQLAEQYLQRRQKELGERIDPDEYPRRLQEVKAYLALHNVYGVDLNATAVELAEISLWLDTMVEGLDAPWFGLHLRRGNSLIGARRAVFRRDQVTTKAYLKEVPRDVPLTSLADDVRDGALARGVDGGVHHFLLPAPGWGSAVDAKEAKELGPEALARLKSWRSAVQAKPTKAQVDALVDLSYRVEALWQIALQRLEIAEREVRRAIPVWGAEGLPSGGAVQREQIELALADAKGAYRRLRRVMDAWCALWFWPLTDTLTTRTVDGVVQRIQPPSLQQWIDALQMLLGRHSGKARTASGGNQMLSTGVTWEELTDHEQTDQLFASAMPVGSVLEKHPWLRVCEAVAEQQGFFHWELEFATVFARGGFDLQVGNPPWVRQEFKLAIAVAEFAPEVALGNERPEVRAWARDAAQVQVDEVLEAATQITNSSSFLRASANYPFLAGALTDLYKSFLERSWALLSDRGRAGLIHSAALYQEESGAELRGESYRRLERLWHFTNELKLFGEIGNRVAYAISVHRRARTSPCFLNACFALHPDVIERSLAHDGSGAAPNIKAEEGGWDHRPHRARIRKIDRAALREWVVDESASPEQAPLMFAVNNLVDRAIAIIGGSPRFEAFGPSRPYIWAGIGETFGVDHGVIRSGWVRQRDASKVVLQGPHIGVANPVLQERGVGMRNHRDWLDVDLRHLPSEPEWVTGYQVVNEAGLIDSMPKVPSCGFDDLFRVAWRRRVSTAGARSLQAAILPPGVKHIDALMSVGHPDWPAVAVAVLCGVLASLPLDFQIRVAQRSDIRGGTLARLRLPVVGALEQEFALRVLRLNCVNAAYAGLWDKWASERAASPVCDRWTSPPPGKLAAQEKCPVFQGRTWQWETALRSDWARRQALLEIDVIVSMWFGLTIEELIGIYRAQFGVFRLEDLRSTGDDYGRSCAAEPGGGYDREADMRQAYTEFERRLAERS
ncbi:class I SAM-dependent DNA methyltransferase [Cellulomonas sp. APG4]|uniref:Eco57I restriction-modification methylase domain-containing protein n=1 Tax=Cellulomonas sp. APG4 TaxID=1538656 RepID=UPI00137A33F9|nr:class I SAM-dependent DNA methyltransferase [Cellulomonas sp. APG4]NCT90972.1 class I SAM-dependent DNA methyltransferase [Cellulomonas sp. APG4]